jgi:hypothetical protein
MFGVGAIPAGVAAARSSGARRGRLIRVLCVAAGVAVIATSLAPRADVAYVLVAFVGFLSIWLIALANTLVQLEPAPAMRGRVMGLWSMVLPGLNPVTGFLIGAVAEFVGPRVGFGLSGLALLAAAAAGWRTLGRNDALAARRAADVEGLSGAQADVW